MTPLWSGFVKGWSIGVWFIVLALIFLSGCTVVVANVQGCGASVDATGDMGMMMERAVNVKMQTAQCPVNPVVIRPEIVRPHVVHPEVVPPSEPTIVKPEIVERRPLILPPAEAPRILPPSEAPRIR